MKKAFKKTIVMALMASMLSTEIAVPAYAGITDKLSELKDSATDAVDKAKDTASDTINQAKKSDAAKKATDAMDKAKTTVQILQVK